VVWGYHCEIGSCVEDCAETCSSLEYECGMQTVCVVLTNCGGCGIGEDCISGICTSYEELRLPFDEDMNDYSGNNRHATCSNCPTQTSGIKGNAYQFDGSGDYIYVPVPSSWGFNQNITVSMWIKKDVGTSGAYVMDIWGGGKSSLYILLNGPLSGNLGKFQISNEEETSFVGVNGINAISDTSWHNIMGVFDSSQQKIYFHLDGNFENSANTGFNTFNPIHQNILIGYFDGCCYFDGAIDEVIIWNKAFNETEIKNYYDSIIS